MKKCFLCPSLLAFLLLTHISQAQIFTAKAGFNLATIKASQYPNSGTEDQKMNPGFHLGMMVEFPVEKRFSIESGLLINSRGVKGLYSDATSHSVYTTNLYYLDLPVTGKLVQPLNKNIKAFAVAGPYMALGLFGFQTSKYTANGSTDRETSSIHWWKNNSPLKKFDAGFTFGLGIERKSMQYSVSYDLGLTKLVDFEPDFWSKNGVLRFSVGYRFGKKFQKM